MKQHTARHKHALWLLCIISTVSCRPVLATQQLQHQQEFSQKRQPEASKGISNPTPLAPYHYWVFDIHRFRFPRMPTPPSSRTNVPRVQRKSLGRLYLPNRPFPQNLPCFKCAYCNISFIKIQDRMKHRANATKAKSRTIKP